jgi:uncharacterized protein (DUF1330 family)
MFVERMGEPTKAKVSGSSVGYPEFLIGELTMVAYVVLTREETTNQAELNEYARKAPAAAEGHGISFLAMNGKHEVLEGSPMEGAVILRFGTIEEAKRWYDSPAYQDALAHRHAGAKYRVFIVEGVE